jgi:hypothetical protein
LQMNDTVMITYLKVQFSTEGARPSDVLETLHNLGFETTQGRFDAIYRWGGNTTIDDALYLADKVHAALKGTGVLFELETVEE